MVPVCGLFRWSIPLSSPASPDTGGISNSVSWTKEVPWMAEGFEKLHRDSYLKQPVAAVLLTSSSACGCHDDHESLLEETACTACGMSQYQQQWSLRSLRGSSAWRLQTHAHRATGTTQILLEPTATISPLYHRGPTGVPRALHPVPSPPALCLPCSLPFERFCL